MDFNAIMYHHTHGHDLGTFVFGTASDQLAHATLGFESYMREIQRQNDEGKSNT